MTINSTAAASGPFIGTGQAQTLPFDFHAASADEVSVIADNSAVSGFSVVLEDDGTGSVTGVFLTGATIYIVSDPSFAQETDFNRFAPYFPDSLNPPLDRAAIRDIALKARIDRSLVAPIGAGDPLEYFRDIGFKGADSVIPGPANNTYRTLEAVAASPTTNLSAIYAPPGGVNRTTYTWTTGDQSATPGALASTWVNPATGTAAPIAQGAWLRPTALAIQTSYGRDVQNRMDDIAGLADKLQINDFDDVKAAAQLAFAFANPGQGRGVTLRAPRKAMFLYEPLTIPALTTIVGAGFRDSFFLAQFDGPMFVFDSVNLSGLRNCRIGMGSGKNVCAIDIKTTTGDARALNFSDLEIAGGGAAGAKSISAGGQTAIRAFTSNGRIVTECVYDRIIMTEIDRPVIMNGPEGNEFTRFVIDQFGYSGQCGMELVTHADYYQGRVAGAPAAGTIGYKQGGFRSQAIIRTDIGNNAFAIDLLENHGNQVILQRPYEAGPPVVQTPVGNFPPGNTLIDGYRMFARGPSPSVSNFVISGFGDGSVVESVTGHDGKVRFTVRAGTMNFGTPAVSYSFSGGPWPYNNAIVSVSRNGGNQNDKAASGASASVNGWGFSPNVVPATGEFYIFQVEVG